MPVTRVPALLLTLAATTACEPTPDPKGAPPAAPAPSMSGATGASGASGSSRPNVECRTKKGEIELAVDWGTGGGVGKGTLMTMKGGKAESRAVRVTTWKGSLLIDAPDEKDQARHLGVISEADGKKQIQIGDDKATPLPCE